MNELPRLSVDLIDKLDDEFPPQLPKPDTSRDVSMFKSGQRDVVNYLIKLKEKATEDDLTGGE